MTVQNAKWDRQHNRNDYFLTPKLNPLKNGTFVAMDPLNVK